MGFFGELKQDLSQVAGSEKKKEEAQLKAEDILAEAEVAGMDEAAEATESAGEYSEDNDDVASLLKDLVSDLGGDDFHEDENGESSEQSDISDDLDSILAGLTEPLPEVEELTEEEAVTDEEPEYEEPAYEEEEAVTSEDDIISDVLADVTEDSSSEEETDPLEEISEDYTSALDLAFAALSTNEEPADEPEEETEEIFEETDDEPSYEEVKEDFANSTYKGADEMETGNFSEETSVITGGMVVNGDIESEGSLDLVGKVNGDVTVKGKLNVTGHIVGNSEAKEIYAENAKITGNVTSESSVKIGAGTVIVGNISAFSAAIAGAVKGDIDVHGPVILDSTAIVMGNIRSKSVQINNGAALEGVCSQAYAEVSPTAFFDDYKPETRPEKKTKKKEEN
ncbi:MAG: polymer-forming cytoskeletal protein [Lachnospiraceae bacterium]|nr:polymer-forming cytoskeletal protein [Lachnospiraceae bacterium]